MSSTGRQSRFAFGTISRAVAKQPQLDQSPVSLSSLLERRSIGRPKKLER